MYQKTFWKKSQTQPQKHETSSTPAASETNPKKLENETEQVTYKKKIRSWRYLSFFKKNGLLIRFSFSQQTIYLSFVKKTTETKYQSFTEGFVVKLPLEGLNELLFCMSLDPPQQWDTWREKKGEKYHVYVTPIPLKEFTLMSGTKIRLPAMTLNFKVQHRSGLLHSFTLSPSETNLILDAFKAFRDQILQNIISNKNE